MAFPQWLLSRDPGLGALRRACRAAIIAPGLFALSFEVIGNSTTAVFATFGSITLLLFVDFGGPIRERITSQTALVVTAGVLVCVGTLASQHVWSATLVVVVVSFGVLFAGVVSSALAGSSAALLAGFIVPVTLPGPVSSIPDRLAGYLMAGAASVIAVGVLWPAPTREPLRIATARACALLARRLRAEVDCIVIDFESGRLKARDEVAAEAATAVAGLRTSFFGTPYRPTGVSTAARALVRLVDEVVWLEQILVRMPLDASPGPSDAVVCEVKLAAADLLERSADLLEQGADGSAAGPDGPGGPDDPGGLRDGLERLREARAAMENAVTSALPSPEPAAGGGSPRPAAARAGSPRAALEGFVGSLEPGFRAMELSFAISAIAANVQLGVAARNRRWWERLLGRPPRGVPTPLTSVPEPSLASSLTSSLSSSLSSVQERAGAHVERHSVWLHNSVRGAVGLGIAVLIAELTGVQHSFWVVFGTMAVLRSSALLTGQNALRAVLGTVVGIAIGGAVIYGVGDHTTVLWFLLPPAILFTGLAPSAFSFAAGQAGFTAALLILFNIIQPAGWSIGLVRIEDVAIGVAVSAGVGALFWPRGAGAALGLAFSDAFAHSARYLSGAVGYAVSRCDARLPAGRTPLDERREAAAAARRLDDAFREFLAERGTKRVPLADVAALISAVAVLRLTADAVLDLWDRAGDTPSGDRTAARAEVLGAAERVCGWYEDTARALGGDGEVPGRLHRDEGADGRLTDAVRRDLTDVDGRGTAAAIRMIWTADHLDVARRLQAPVVEPARAAATLQRRLNRLPRRAALRRDRPTATGA